MSAEVMFGAPVADEVLDRVAQGVARLAAEGRSVGLGTILVGDDPAGVGYVAKKHETCRRIGMASFDERIPAGSGQTALLGAVARFNADAAIDAFIVQHPLPPGFDFNQAMSMVRPDKDADGLHPQNLGLLALGGRGSPRPCTPSGIQAILAHYQVPVAGADVVVVGRGPTLGRPLSMLLGLKEHMANAAVTQVHTGVANWRDYTTRADIVIGAAGVASMITPDVIRPGACVVGGGITWQGRRLLSDVDEACAEVARWVTPRLGGVGVTTVAMLLLNTLRAAEARGGDVRPADVRCEPS